ncbi:MAG: putative rane protein, partial [Planctomycetota bacterium]
EWLGTQGDPWDAQWDMTMALIGAVLAMITVPRLVPGPRATYP